MHVIGLTGSLSTGKTTVLQMFKDKRAKILDADRIAHRCLNNEKYLKKVVEEFGKEVLRGGTIDRKRLAKVVFEDEKKLKKLEAIIHPAVKKEIKETIKKLKADGKTKVLVIEVPLLFESGMDSMVDSTIAVITDQKTQLMRAKKYLSITRHEAMKRIKNQMPLKEKIRLADLIIDNTNDLKYTIKQVEEIWQKLQ